MDPVLNRKLFADRSARRRLSEMGGIMASSPELMNEVRTFQDGGAVTEMLGRTEPLPGASFEETTARTARILLREAKRRLASGDPEGARQVLEQAASFGSEEAQRLLNPEPQTFFEPSGSERVPFGQQVGDTLRGIFQPVGAWMREALQPVGEAGREFGQPIGETMHGALQPVGEFGRSVGQPLGAAIREELEPLREPPLGMEVLSGLDRRAMFEPIGSPSDLLPSETLRDDSPLSFNQIISRAQAGMRPTADELRLAVEANQLNDQQAADVLSMIDDPGYIPSAEEVAVANIPDPRQQELRDLAASVRAGAQGRAEAAQEMRAGPAITEPLPLQEIVTGAATLGAETLGETGDPGEASNATLTSFGIEPASDIKGRVKQYQDLFKELLGESDEDKAQEMWLNLAMVGFAIASGTSPNALQNISAGLLEGSKKMAESRAASRERSDRLTSLAITSAMDEAAEERAIQRENAMLAARAEAAAEERESERQLQFDLIGQRHRNALELAKVRNPPAGVDVLNTPAGEAMLSLVEEGVKSGLNLNDAVEGLSAIGPEFPGIYRNAMRQVPTTGAAVDQVPTIPGTVFYDSVEQQYMVVGEDGIPVPYGE